MTRKTVGYFEGTDSTLLTSFICNGFDTLPVSNGVDHHGKSVYLINDKEKYDILIGYVHKLYHPEWLHLPYQRLFHICSTYSIPLLIEVPEPLQDQAKALMPEAPDVVEFLDPQTFSIAPCNSWGDMTTTSTPQVLLSCEVLESYLSPLLDGTTESTFFDLGLHDQPSLMRPTLQEKIDAIAEPSTVLIGYGLCGNGVVGLEAGPHTLVLPRAHDCIGMAYGSGEAHAAAISAHPGTYYLTRGWLNTGNDPLEQYRRYIEQYGQKRADRVVDAYYGHYERVCLMAFSAEELDAVRPLAAPVVQFFQDRWQLEYVERVGDPEFVERLVSDEQKAPDEFVIVEPGGTVKMEMFL